MPTYQLKCVTCGAPMGEGFLPIEGVQPNDPRLCPYRCDTCDAAWRAAGCPQMPAYAAPVPSHLIPSTGRVGDKVLVLGALDSDKIYFAGVEAVAVEVVPTGVLATVPARAVSGAVTVDTGFIDSDGVLRDPTPVGIFTVEV